MKYWIPTGATSNVCGKQSSRSFNGASSFIYLAARLTSAGTLNFSTTPSSKNMRMPALMRSNSETGKSLKENR